MGEPRPVAQPAGLAPTGGGTTTRSPAPLVGGGAQAVVALPGMDSALIEGNAAGVAASLRAAVSAAAGVNVSAVLVSGSLS
jgi:hypothetical protein